MKLSEQLHLPKGIYNPSRYPNPSLQWHYRILQALALDEDLPAKPEDKTIPKHRQIDKRVGNEAIEWGKTLEATYKEYLSENPDAATIGSKRTTNGASTAGRGAAESKKVKTEPGEIISEAQMRGHQEDTSWRQEGRHSREDRKLVRARMIWDVYDTPDETHVVQMMQSNLMIFRAKKSSFGGMCGQSLQSQPRALQLWLALHPRSAIMVDLHSNRRFPYIMDHWMATS